MEHSINAIVGYLIRSRQPYNSITEFSPFPGIYAVFCALDRLPFIDAVIRPDEILYIGKTESSQLSRDAKTHFADGCTGSSTLRRTFGALLREQLGLKPIPRNATDAAKGKFSHYKFDDESESNLTKWMKENLSLSFFEFIATKQELEELETRLIQALVPKLNISKNPGNPWRKTVKAMRQETAHLSHGAPGKPSRRLTESIVVKAGVRGDGQYTELWKRVCSRLEPSIGRGAESATLQLDVRDFEAAGNRKKYAFNLEFQEGRVSNNIKGSEVARHLASTLIESRVIMDKVSTGHWKFQLDSGFCLHVSKRR